MTAGIVESIRFTKTPGTCENGGDHSLYQIRWFDGDQHGINGIYWCDHPFCDTSAWRFRMSPPEVKLTTWIPRWPAVATAYLLLVYPIASSALFTPRMEARVGIVDQWQDPQFGNFGEDGEMKLFSERYFAESGPGVYPAPITTVASDGVNASVNP